MSRLFSLDRSQDPGMNDNRNRGGESWPDYVAGQRRSSGTSLPSPSPRGIPGVPWPVKLAAAAIAAYALSPIDLIPDVIPILGYLDELIILPIAIVLVIRMIPSPLMAEFRAEAQRRSRGRPVSRVAAAMIIGLWVAVAAFLIWVLWPTPAPLRQVAPLVRVEPLGT